MKYKCPICKTEQKYRGVCCNCNENFLEYRAYAEKDEWILSKLNCTYSEYRELVKDKKDTYEKVKKHYENLEKNRRYIKGKQISTFDELLKQKIVWLGESPKPISFILSMQLTTVKNMLGRQLWYCVEKTRGQFIAGQYVSKMIEIDISTKTQQAKKIIFTNDCEWNLETRSNIPLIDENENIIGIVKSIKKENDKLVCDCLVHSKMVNDYDNYSFTFITATKNIGSADFCLTAKILSVNKCKK